MKYAIIVGSHRKDSQSLKVGKYIETRIKILYPDAETYLLNLQAANLPMWDEGFWKGGEKWKTAWSPVAAELQTCDAIIPITPEWSGMATPIIKNFFLLASTKEIGHKPGMIVSVSSGRGGAYPINELRTSSYKNNQICYIPEHLIIRFVVERLNEPKAVDENDAITRQRIDYAIGVLSLYSENFRNIRAKSEVWMSDVFKFGM